MGETETRTLTISVLHNRIMPTYRLAVIDVSGNAERWHEDNHTVRRKLISSNCAVELDSFGCAVELVYSGRAVELPHILVAL